MERQRHERWLPEKTSGPDLDMADKQVHLQNLKEEKCRPRFRRLLLEEASLK